MQEASARTHRAPRPLEPAARPRPDLHVVDAAPARRTVVITGRPDPAPRRRESRARANTVARPDRVAAWAVGLGLFMAFMAGATAKAAELPL